MDKKLESKFKEILNDYNHNKHTTYDRYSNIPWIKEWDPKDFDDAKFIYRDDDSSNINRYDINELIRLKYIYPIESMNLYKSFAIEVRGHFLWYLRLTSEGVDYFKNKRKQNMKFWIPLVFSLIATALAIALPIVIK
jgi:hypothetical protein